MRRFSAWLTEEGEQAADPLLGLKSPKLDQPVTEPLSDDQLRAMLQACRGPDLRDKRDEAILRLMFTTGARAGEVVALQVSDVNLRSVPPTAIIRRGKGGKGCVITLAIEVAAAIDKYIRARKSHRLKNDPALWLGDRGKGFTYDAIHQTLGDGERAGVTGFHPHRLRHTAAHRWFAKGGTEGGLMAVAGWTRPDMLMKHQRPGLPPGPPGSPTTQSWGVVTDIKIVCQARSHQQRSQIVARFHDGGGSWLWISGAQRDRVRFEHVSHFQLLDGDVPVDGDQHPAADGYRVRYRFECGMCGNVKTGRQENLFDKFNRLRDANAGEITQNN